ncbi:hypothetical protein Nepgr_005390 [Nepenthes gracilis]|uniref:Uncharacterized protein n=1 Tax=Nepenthes gracilis TaxID=150966 RepID=A0AAD3S385_NEPGR|nr:hypothetical protein Nepgr_005390 [Nepenthes gracilis]
MPHSAPPPSNFQHSTAPQEESRELLVLKKQMFQVHQLQTRFSKDQIAKIGNPTQSIQSINPTYYIQSKRPINELPIQCTKANRSPTSVNDTRNFHSGQKPTNSWSQPSKGRQTNPEFIC